MDILKIIQKKYPLFLAFKNTSWNQNATIIYKDLEEAVVSFIEDYPSNYHKDFLMQLDNLLADDIVLDFITDRERSFEFNIKTGGMFIPLEHLRRIRNYTLNHLKNKYNY